MNTVASHCVVPDIGRHCPLTGLGGVELRKREAGELLELYTTYCGMPLPASFLQQYFPGQITELYSAESGLRWYSPTLLGDSDFYSHLGRYPGYYGSETWDKTRTVEILSSLKPKSFVDIGCGDGLLLKLAAKSGVRGFGLEINAQAVDAGREKGLTMYLETDSSIDSERPEVLVTLQALEHVLDPAAWLGGHLERFKPQYAIVAVPCHDTLLGRINEPLVWPPHHATLWSGKALKILAKQLGYEVQLLEYEGISWNRFNGLLEKESIPRKLWGLPRFPAGRIGHLAFQSLKRLGVDWVSRVHTALVLMERI